VRKRQVTWEMRVYLDKKAGNGYQPYGYQAASFT
jgi:hypothetical protein